MTRKAKKEAAARIDVQDGWPGAWHEKAREPNRIAAECQRRSQKLVTNPARFTCWFLG